MDLVAGSQDVARTSDRSLTFDEAKGVALGIASSATVRRNGEMGVNRLMRHLHSGQEEALASPMPCFLLNPALCP
jgi:hypothetical protein